LYNDDAVTTPQKQSAPLSPDTGIFTSNEDLAAVCKRMRRDILNMIFKANSGHPGGSLSAVEMIVALYWRIMKHKPGEPHWPDRDRFILSKGHAAPVLYAALAECGYFPKEALATLRQTGSILQGHTERTHTPGVEMSSGSLGQGLSVAVGAALAGRLDNAPWRVYCMISDSECQEGQTWEAITAGGNYKVDNLTVLVDNNGVQLSGFDKDIMNVEPLHQKFDGFGWNVIEIDGHNIDQVLHAIKISQTFKGKPTIIIAHTVKGKGVSFMENNVEFHGKAPNAEQLEKALKELA
jgi:transketolase